jgi:hypothetical protein
MKWTVSQRSGGAPDSEQYLVRCAPDCLGNGRIQQSTTTDPNGRLTWQASDSEQCMSGAHRTVRCARRQKAAAFCPIAKSVGRL